MDAEIPQTRRAALTSTKSGQAVFVGLWILGTLATLAALAAAYLLGQYIGAPPGEEDAVEVVIEAQTPVPKFPILSGEPVGTGTWAWDELRGGECISSFMGPFDETFQVVDCDAPHNAQLISAALVSRESGAAFPGQESLSATAREMCEGGDTIARFVAENYRDLVIEYAYPITNEQWVAGQRAVYCFVTSASGQMFTQSLLDSPNTAPDVSG